MVFCSRYWFIFLCVCVFLECICSLLFLFEALIGFFFLVTSGDSAQNQCFGTARPVGDQKPSLAGRSWTHHSIRGRGGFWTGACAASIDFHIWAHLYYCWSPITVWQAKLSFWSPVTCCLHRARGVMSLFRRTSTSFSYSRKICFQLLWPWYKTLKKRVQQRSVSYRRK